MSKQLHVISVGTSILTNYFRMNNLGYPNFGDEEFWRQKENDSDFLANLFHTIVEKPREMSAELNSFLGKTGNVPPENVFIYLVGTNTPAGRITLRILEEYLVWRKYRVLGSYKSVHGNLEDMSKLMDTLLKIVMENRDDYDEILFNPTGGVKAHVMLLSIASALTACPIYYIHEESKDIVEYPPLFYIPKEDELEFLKAIHGGHDVSRYFHVLERLERYNLVHVEREGNEVVHVELTWLGRMVMKEVLG